jgi:hypothetical protein
VTTWTDESSCGSIVPSRPAPFRRRLGQFFARYGLGHAVISGSGDPTGEIFPPSSLRAEFSGPTGSTSVSLNRLQPRLSARQEPCRVTGSPVAA